MRRHSIAARLVVQLLVFCFLNMMLLSTPGLTKPIDCPYDKANPTLENARLSFRTLNYQCAEQEIEDFLLLEKITIEEKADAHVLLAAVYYAKLKNDESKRKQVINQFKEAFKAYRAWKGDLDISSTEFFEMMQTAQTMVDEEAESAPAEPEVPPVSAEKPAEDTGDEEIAAIVDLSEDEQEEDVAETMPPYQGEQDEQVKASKPWYKKWWAIGLGVGVIAVVAVAASGGGGSDDGGTTNTDLPDFPDPPTSQRNTPNKDIK